MHILIADSLSSEVIMQTITSYKVVYVDSYGDLKDIDFTDETEARNFASSVNASEIFKVQMLGSIERI